tara:strand:- start:233 stop:379 length:147 start_codon:yes stop_codon:yes gene_type:complete
MLLIFAEEDNFEKRDLGLVVCRGTSVMAIAPSDGAQEIANPFLEEAVI